MNLVSLLGWLQTILFSILLIPQIIKTIKVKKVDEVSIAVFVISLVANIIALYYALLINQAPLIFKYITGGILSLVYIIIYIIYLKKKGNKC